MLYCDLTSLNVIMPSSVQCMMKNCFISTCRVRRVGCCAFESCLAPLLSTRMSVGSVRSSPSSSRIDRIYRSALPASAMADSSASVELSATVGWILVRYRTAPPAIINTIPLTDRRCIRSVAHVASDAPYISSDSCSLLNCFNISSGVIVVGSGSSGRSSLGSGRQ